MKEGISCVLLHTLEELLFQLSFCDLDFDGLVDLLLVSPLVVGIVLDGCGEEGVDECGLSQAGFTSNLGGLMRSVYNPWSFLNQRSTTHHDSEGSTSLCDNLVALYDEVS